MVALELGREVFPIIYVHFIFIIFFVWKKQLDFVFVFEEFILLFLNKKLST